MNCKPGDLAVFVRSHDQRNIGKHVHVLQRYGKRSWWIVCASVVHRKFSDCPAGAECVTLDEYLRPIRFNPGEDEILRISGKPQEVKDELQAG